MPPLHSGTCCQKIFTPEVDKALKIGSALLIIASLGVIAAGIMGVLPFDAVYIGSTSSVVSFVALAALFSCTPKKESPLQESSSSSVQNIPVALENSLHYLIPFYHCVGSDREGRVFDQILNQDDAWLENTHNYIQWLFPLDRQSQFNNRAPVLNAPTIRALHRNLNMLRAFDRMLAFYGLERVEERVQRGVNWEERSRNWITRNNHNFMRITRILTSLRLFGFEKEAAAFFDQLSTIYQEHGSKIGDAFNHWQGAIQA